MVVGCLGKHRNKYYHLVAPSLKFRTEFGKGLTIEEYSLYNVNKEGRRPHYAAVAPSVFRKNNRKGATSRGCSFY